ARVHVESELTDIVRECEITPEDMLTPTATDNCAGTIDGSTKDPLDYGDQGTYTITWIYEDGNGNTSTQDQTLIVDDQTAPVPDESDLPDIVRECEIAPEDILTPTATDNCAGTIDGSTNDPLDYGDQGTYAITWIYEDGNGNTSTQDQTLIVD